MQYILFYNIFASLFGIGLILVYRYRIKNKIFIHNLPAIKVDVDFCCGTHPIQTDNTSYRNEINLYDARLEHKKFVIDKHGFKLTKVNPNFGNCNLSNIADCINLFFPKCENLIKLYYPNSVQVLAFDHILRSSHNVSYNNQFNQQILSTPHGDYTRKSGYSRCKQLLSSYVDQETLKKIMNDRFAIINIWYPLQTVESYPLAMCLWDTVKPIEAQTNKLFFPNRIAETYKLNYSKHHKWIYFSNMTNNEAIIFKTYDSKKTCARFCFHSAIKLPNQPPKNRLSIEVRLLVLWNKHALNIKNFKPPYSHNANTYVNERNQILSSITLPPQNEW
tara:strand:+ start:1217 stop:2215 length:999 start_codon:yes stop_codon:yes gene_type:complete